DEHQNGGDRGRRPRRESRYLSGRGRGDGRRHREHAVSRGSPSDARRTPPPFARPDSRDAGTLRYHGRSEDQTYPALGQGLARTRSGAGYHRHAERTGRRSAYEEEDLGVL